MAVPALARQMASDHPETPMSKFMPQIAAIPRQTFNAIVGLTGKAIVGAATCGPVKSLVSSFADKVVVEEALTKIEDLDPSYWAYWLAATGYSSQAGASWGCRKRRGVCHVIVMPCVHGCPHAPMLPVTHAPLI